MPTIYHQITALRDVLQTNRSAQRIALVPTMGNLHDGHLELVKLARQHADIVVVSIFVNPTQFGVGEDFDSYPRTLDADVSKLASVGADMVFAPSVDEMYPVMPPSTVVRAGSITEQLCGQSRPTHFDGVGIVVAKLFNIVQPDVAIFGQKDYQQLAIIKQIVRDLSYPIDIVGAPIVRASDGLALSSRNQYLTDEERQTAPVLQQELQRLGNAVRQDYNHINDKINDKTTDAPALDTLITDTKARLTKAGFQVDYVEVKTAQLEPIGQADVNLADAPQTLVILAAAWLGRARLLDNVVISLRA